MDKKYSELFALISQSVANLAEQVANMHQTSNEEKEAANAFAMRDDFLTLHDKVEANDKLNKADYARLLVGTIITTNQLETRIANEQKALQGYKIDLLPKLDRINNTSVEEVDALAAELFTVKEEEPKLEE